jgi:hypothetical protein
VEGGLIDLHQPEVKIARPRDAGTHPTAAPADGHDRQTGRQGSFSGTGILTRPGVPNENPSALDRVSPTVRFLFCWIGKAVTCCLKKGRVLLATRVARWRMATRLSSARVRRRERGGGLAMVRDSQSPDATGWWALHHCPFY